MCLLYKIMSCAFLSSLHGVRDVVSHMLSNMENEVTTQLWNVGIHSIVYRAASGFITCKGDLNGTN